MSKNTLKNYIVDHKNKTIIKRNENRFENVQKEIKRVDWDTKDRLRRFNGRKNILEKIAKRFSRIKRSTSSPKQDFISIHKNHIYPRTINKS